MRRNLDLKYASRLLLSRSFVGYRPSILDSAVCLLKPGGLLYATSQHPAAEENEAIAGALQRRPPGLPVLDASELLEQLKVEGARASGSGVRTGQ